LARQTSREIGAPVTLGDIANTVGLCLIAFVFVFPILWTAMMSLKTRVDALSMPPKWLFVPTFQRCGTRARSSPMPATA